MRKILIMTLFFLLMILSSCMPSETTVKEALFTADYDLAEEDRYPLIIDFAIDVSDPGILYEASDHIFIGKIKGIERTTVDQAGFIETVYRVEVDTDIKGKTSTEVMVPMVGGQMTLGEYIKILNEKALPYQAFPDRSGKFLEEHDINRSMVINPREADPNQLVKHNFGINPASPSFITENKPEAFIFYTRNEGDLYYMTALNYSLMYIKDGQVYNVLQDEAASKPFSLKELSK